MEALIIQLVIAFAQAIPSVVDAINKSTSLSQDDKDKLLATIDIHLTSASAAVAATASKFNLPPL